MVIIFEANQQDVIETISQCLFSNVHLPSNFLLQKNPNLGLIKVRRLISLKGLCKSCFPVYLYGIQGYYCCNLLKYEGRLGIGLCY